MPPHQPPMKPAPMRAISHCGSFFLLSCVPQRHPSPPSCTTSPRSRGPRPMHGTRAVPLLALGLLLVAHACVTANAAQSPVPADGDDGDGAGECGVTGCDAVSAAQWEPEG